VSDPSSPAPTPPPAPQSGSPLRAMLFGIVIGVAVLGAIAALLRFSGWGWWGAEH
jgi:hypothetical protein